MMSPPPNTTGDPDGGNLPGQPIPDEILTWATPDMLQLMAMACNVAGNRRGADQVAHQQMMRVGMVSWVFAPPDAAEERKRRGRRRRPPVE